MRAGSTRRLAGRSSSPIRPKSSRTANAGTGKMVGRCRTRPRVLVNSALLTGLGATAFTGPRRESVVSAKLNYA
jgi:hypothetical protein